MDLKDEWLTQTNYYENVTGLQLQEIMNKMNEKSYINILANQPFMSKVREDTLILWSGFITFRINYKKQMEMAKLPDKTDVVIAKETNPNIVAAISKIKINI